MSSTSTPLSMDAGAWPGGTSGACVRVGGPLAYKVNAVTHNHADSIVFMCMHLPHSKIVQSFTLYLRIAAINY